MKSVFLLLLGTCMLCACCETRTQHEPINRQIREFIQQTCEENKPCNIEIKKSTDFAWDKLYVFQEAVENDVISKILGTEYSTTARYYSRKWFFVKDNQIVRFEAHIPLGQ